MVKTFKIPGTNGVVVLLPLGSVNADVRLQVKTGYYSRSWEAFVYYGGGQFYNARHIYIYLENRVVYEAHVKTFWAMIDYIVQRDITDGVLVTSEVTT